MVSAKEKSGNSTNLLRVKKGLKKKKKKAFELDVDACMMIIYDPTLALQKEEGFLFNFEIEEEDLMKNEFMGFDELNVKINQMRITEEEEEEEEENLLDSSCTAASSSSSEFLMEGGDNCSWPSDELDEILNDFGDITDDHHQENMFDLLQSFLDSFLEFLVEGDSADHNHDHNDNMFDLLPSLSDPPRLPLTNAFIDNILFNSTSDNWPSGTMVEWDQLFS